MSLFAESMNPRKNRKKTTFGNPSIIMGGKKKFLRSMIHENAKDTGIYEQIDKYGLNPIQETSIEETVQDFVNIAGDLRTSIERGMMAKKKWNELPKEIRKEFNHDINDFMKNGFNWMEEKQKKFLEEKERKAQELQKAIITAGGNNE